MRTLEMDDSGRKCPTLPPAGEHVVVHCSKFSCLGYLDQNGTWKNVFTNEVLSEVVDFSPIG
jgi:hypothetical protein